MGVLRDGAARLLAAECDGRFGNVVSVRGAMIELAGLGRVAVGTRLTLTTPQPLPVEVVGLSGMLAQCMPFAEPRGVAVGTRADLVDPVTAIRPCDGWRGRIVDALGEPLDGHGPLPRGPLPRPLRAVPPPATTRAPVGGRIVTGVRAIDLFAPLCRGQRLGLFAGSGVGKSVLMAMLARWVDADIVVVGLIGERGRELRAFVEDTLGSEGMARAVLVVATSDTPAMMRRAAAWTTLAVAEHFRDAGAHVLCVMDSVTRFAMAEREIGLAAGEPPATRGYTPGVFAALPRLLERAGPGGPGQGAITGIFTVLVDGGDHDEPIADAVRGILDGHIVMDRAIGERGRYPAIDVLKSVSRTLPACLPDAANTTRIAARAALSRAEEMAELASLGAYRPGSDPAVDRALALAPRIDALLNQGPRDRGEADGGFARLNALLDGADDA